MKKEYKRAIHQAFSDAFLSKEPGFVPTKPVAPYFSASELLLTSMSANRIMLLVVVSPHGNGHEAFTVEVGWSTTGEVPRLGMRPSAGDPRSVTVESAGEYVTRLGYLDQSVPEFWYVEPLSLGSSPEDVLKSILASTEEVSLVTARERVAPSVSEALAATVRVGLPFLRTRVG